MGTRTNTKPFKPPPPPPKDGSPAYALKVKGYEPLRFRDLIECLRHLRSLRKQRPGISAVVVRVVDRAVLAFTVKTCETVRQAVDNAHMHRPNARQKTGS